MVRLQWLQLTIRRPKRYLTNLGRKSLILVPYDKHISIHTLDAQEIAEKERGLGLLDKAEASYRQAQQSAQGMKAGAMIDDAQAAER